MQKSKNEQGGVEAGEVRGGRFDELTDKVIGTAIALHRELGPGLVESAYEICLARDLRDAGLRVETQKTLPLTYRGMTLQGSYRLDLLVEDRLVVELKAVEQLTALHKAQLMTYLRLSGFRTGLLINFNVLLLRDGIRRIVR